MINLQPYQDLISENKGLLFNTITNPITTQSFKLRKFQSVPRWVLSNNVEDLRSIDTVIYSDDHISYLTEYCKELMTVDFDSILIAGLGIGIIPYIMKDNCSVVDVVEINSEMINLIEGLNYLGNTNIINENIFDFTPTKNYDIILLDIWTCDCYPSLSSELNTLVQKYLPYLNTNGFVYVPLNFSFGQTKFYQ